MTLAVLTHVTVASATVSASRATASTPGGGTVSATSVTCTRSGTLYGKTQTVIVTTDGGLRCLRSDVSGTVVATGRPGQRSLMCSRRRGRARSVAGARTKTEPQVPNGLARGAWPALSRW